VLPIRRFVFGVAEQDLAQKDDEKSWRDLIGQYHTDYSHQKGLFCDVQSASDRLRHEALRRVRGDAMRLARRFSRFQLDSNQRGFDYWREIVALYTQRVLTYDSDILPAISGLACKWASEASGKYCSGLWEHDLPRGLLWNSTGLDVKRQGKQPEDYMGPSWAWASVRRNIDWVQMKGKTQYHVEVAHVSCATDELNPYRLVSGGHIELTRSLVSGILWNVGSDSLVTKPGCHVRGMNGLSHVFIADNTEVCREILYAILYLLRMCTELLIGSEDKGFDYVLVLYQSSNCPDTFRRIGIIEYYPVDKWHMDAVIRRITIV